MRLFMIEHYDEGLWYFTTKAKTARFIDTSPYYLDKCMKIGKKCKGWSISEINDDNVLSRYIDPERKIRQSI